MDAFVRVHEQRSGRCDGCVFNKPHPSGVGWHCTHPVQPVSQCNATRTIFAMVEPKARTNDPYADKAAAVRAEWLAARRTDPATSKGNRKVNKYEQAVLDVLAGAHHTGKEIAAVSGQPLNSITPRFAPLRRKGLIKDSGVRRDKQIVWVLA